MKGAGRYRERIEIQKYSYEQQPDLTFKDVWTTYFSTWCDRQMEKGGIESIVRQDNIIQPFTFNIRYRRQYNEISIGDRIVYRGNVFKIHSFLWNIIQSDLK